MRSSEANWEQGGERKKLCLCHRQGQVRRPMHLRAHWVQLLVKMSGAGKAELGETRQVREGGRSGSEAGATHRGTPAC